MTEVTWGQLAKAVDDKTTVSEEIDAKILAHNNDPSAHSQTNEALYNHRVAEILDHLDESINNIKLKYPVRAYNAIVAQDGSGDYTDIQSAIDAVHSAGGGSILIRSGSYPQSSDITLYSNIELIGEDDEDTVIDFNNTAYGIKCVGSVENYQYNIHLSNLQIKRSRDTTYGALYFHYVQDSFITNCLFDSNKNANSTAGNDIYLDETYRLYIAHNRFQNFYDSIVSNVDDYSVFEYNYFSNGTDKCFYIIGMVKGKILGNIANFGGRYFIYVEDVIEYITILYNYVINGNPTTCKIGGFEYSIFSHNTLLRTSGTGYGIDMYSGNNSIISNNHIEGYSYDGINAGYVNYCIFSNNVIIQNGSDGIDLTNGVRNTIIGNVTVSNSSRGIYLRSGTSNNEVIGNIAYNNTTAQIINSGTGNDVAHNITT